MNKQTVSKLWWIEVLERVGRLPSRPQKDGNNYILDNPVYARSLARQYLASFPASKQARDFQQHNTEVAA